MLEAIARPLLALLNGLESLTDQFIVIAEIVRDTAQDLRLQVEQALGLQDSAQAGSDPAASGHPGDAGN